MASEPEDGKFQRVVQFYRKHKVVFIIIFVTLPQWVQAVFGLFSTEAFLPWFRRWVQRSNLTIPHISPYWISGSFSILIALLIAWFDWKRGKTAAKAKRDQPTVLEPLKSEELLGFEAIRTEDRSAVSLMYGCEIVVQNLDNHEAVKDVIARIVSFEPQPKEFYGSDITSPIPADFPIRLEAQGGASIGPGSELRFELLKLIRTSNIPTIRISGNGKIYRPFNGEIRAWEGRTPIIVPYHFTVEVLEENRHKATWRIDLRFVGDAKGIPTIEVEKVERIP